MPEDIRESRTCSKCGETKPLDQFPRGGKCRACLAAYQREYRRANPEKVRVSEAKRYQRHGDKRRVLARVIYEANREERQEYARRYYAENEAANHERNRERRRIQRQSNPEKAAEYTRRYREKNPFVVTTTSNNRRARIAGKTVSAAEVTALWTGVCALCCEGIDADVMYPDPLSKSLDHIVPLAKGGMHEVANLQWAHISCNRRKSDR